ncbi:MAG: glycerophosphodiester phosphodiesterase [Methylococcaceae bacterium]
MLNQFYKPTVLAGAILVILGFQSVAEAEPQFQMKNTPIVIGHRGAAGYRPEHTIEGYTLAIQMGADFIEPDLVLTKDGHMIARHEPMIGGTTDVASHTEFADRKTKRMVDGVEYNDWFATDFTLAEIKTLHAIQARAGRDKQYDGKFQIPTLDEIIALAKSQSKATGRAIGIYPEIKHSTYHANVKDANNHLLYGLNVFENKLLKKLHKAYGNSACAPVFIQSFEVSNLQYLSHKTDIQLVQLVDADDVNADGSMSLVVPYKQPYDFVVSGDTRTFADLLTDEGLTFVKSYADAVGPWKPYLVKTVDDGVDRNKDSKLTINDRRIDGSTGVVEMAHEKGLLVHTWTFRNDASGYGFTDPEQEMTYYYDLGVDGLFTDFADTGVEARDASVNASNVSSNNQCKLDHDEHNDHEHKDHGHHLAR